MSSVLSATGRLKWCIKLYAPSLISTKLFDNPKKGASGKSAGNIAKPYCETITKIRQYHNNQNI